MNFIEKFVKVFKHTVLNNKRVHIYISPTDYNTFKVEVEIDAPNIPETELAEVYQFLYENYEYDVNNPKLTFTEVSKVKELREKLYHYFDDKGYAVSYLDLTFFNRLLK